LHCSYPDRDYREIAAEWHRITSGIVVVTLGPEGVYAPHGLFQAVRRAQSRRREPVGTHWPAQVKPERNV
jgi:hypothetical protein